MFLQTWLQQCRETNKACNYHLYKTEFKLETYLDNLPKSHRISLTKIRTSNHKLPIEKGRYLNLIREQRTCNLCTLNLVGDEFHFLLECKQYDNLRNVLLGRLSCPEFDQLNNQNKFCYI